MMPDEVKRLPSDRRAYKLLDESRKLITLHEYYTLKGQIRAGNAIGAMKGLRNILLRRVDAEKWGKA